MAYITARRLLNGLRRPSYALRVGWRLATNADERFVSRLTGTPTRLVQHFMNEPFADEKLANHLWACEKSLRESGRSDVADKRTLRIIYALVRAMKPATVVETGVKHGWSSTYILAAMEQNEHGALYSIDIHGLQDDGRANGWIVPGWLRHRWDFRVADAKIALIPMLEEVKGTDIFFHDSLHSYDHMMWEFEASYPLIRDGGLLLADDAVWNEAFSEFAVNSSITHYGTLSGLGVLRKESA